MDKKLRVTQVKSAIGRKEDQKRTIKAMGIKHLNKSVFLPDNPAIQGMISKVTHLVTVEKVDGE